MSGEFVVIPGRKTWCSNIELIVYSSRFSLLVVERMDRLTLGGTTKSVSQDQILEREWEQGKLLSFLFQLRPRAQDWYRNLSPGWSILCLRQAHKNWFVMVIPVKTASATGTAFGTTGPVPADYRHWTPSVRSCVARWTIIGTDTMAEVGLSNKGAPPRWAPDSV